MNKDYPLLAFTVVGTLAFNFLFWQEKMGVNVLLFDLMIGLMIFNSHPNVINQKGTVITGSCTLLLALSIMFNNSVLTKFIHAISFCGFLGFVHFKRMTFIGEAILLGVSVLLEAPMKAIKNWSIKTIGRENSKSILKWLKLCIVPLFIVGVFYAIYYVASPKFASIVTEVWTKAFEIIITSISIPHLLFFLIGFLFVCGVLLPSYYFKNYYKKAPPETLNREEIRKSKLEPSKSSLALKSEYRIAWLVIASLNLLLFLVNLIDIRYVWFDSDSVTPNQLSSYVHEGTYLLIFAILLAMAVVVYYFRRNLNFYPNNNSLILLTYLWVGQNAILALSVAIRNIHYVEYYGLAYKRLGVFLFLILVFVGLLSMYLKIRDKRNLYYLIIKNVWAVYFAFVIVSLINWDVVISKYNVTVPTKSKIDIAYLMEDLSDKNLYILLDHKSDLEKSIRDRDYVKNMIEIKISEFKYKQNNLSWRSWNYSDYRNKKKLLELN